MADDYEVNTHDIRVLMDQCTELFRLNKALVVRVKTLEHTVNRQPMKGTKTPSRTVKG